MDISQICALCEFCSMPIFNNEDKIKLNDELYHNACADNLLEDDFEEDINI